MTAIVRVPSGAPERAAAAHAVNAAADQWVAAGPAVVIRGQATGLPRVAGRIVALAVETEGQRVYAASALGGVWYSGDAGAHWIALDFYASTLDAGNALLHADALTVGALAVRWGATAADDVVYVGAGEHPTSGLEAPSATLAAVGIRRATGPVVAVAPVGAAVVGAAAADPWRVEAANLDGLAVNRFALDLVTDGVVWAATSRGLYRRTPGAAPQWDRVNIGLPDGEIADVVVVAGLVGEPQRIYATAIGGATVRSADDGAHWQAVVLPPFPEAEVPAAVAIGRVRLAAGNVPGNAVVWAVADGPRLWRIDGDAAERVSGLPRAIVEDDPEALKPYVLAIAAHPETDAAHRDVIVVGGQTFAFPADRRHAALFTAQVTRVGGTLTFPPGPLVDGAPAGWIGGGVPNGVQAVAWVRPAAAGPAHLWVGGDGGVFRSDNNGARASFGERNTGLGTIEITTFAQAVDADSVVIAGTRSNGLVRRRSAETWDIILHGRVGGVAVDPGNARRMYAQQAGAVWRYTEHAGSKPFVDLAYQSKTPLGLSAADLATWKSARAKEHEESAPLSRIGLIAVGGSPYGTQHALGTNRIWYTDDQRLFEAKAAAAGGALLSGWVTLPSLTDPYDSARAGAPLGDQDRLDGAVLAAEWGADDRLYVLTRDCVYFFERRANGTWNNPDKLYDGPAVQKAQKFKTPSGQIPWELPRTALAVHQFAQGKGTLYVGTSGDANKHHLWWYDGNGRWLDTGFDKDTPVHAIAVDPRNQQVLYIGTDRGVYRGTGNFPLNADPNWVWALYSDGLPGGACVDLAIYSPEGSPRRLLRTAVAGRGLWEVLLDGVAQGPEVYLRAHGFESRRGEIAIGGARNPYCVTRAQTPLDASPDIRVGRAPASAPPEPIDYAIGPASDAFDIWRLLAALRALGEDIDPRAGWILPAAPAALAHRQALLPLPAVPTARQVWEAVLAGNPLPHDRTPADHADLVAYMREEPDRWPKGFHTSCVAGDDPARISITVHSRHWQPIADGTLSVALLMTEYGRHHSLAEVRPLPAAWGNRLRDDRAIAPGAWPGVTPPLLAGAGWEYADPAAPFRAVTGPFDPLNPQVVVYDVALPRGSDAWNKPGWLLLAVLVVTGDVPPAETDVARLVRTDRRVAARSVRKAALIKDGVDVAGIDISDYPGDADMDLAWAETNVVWTGAYFPSPRPQAALGDPGGGGHHRLWGIPGPHPAVDPWPGAWAHLFPDWGIALIYWGQQAPVAGAGPFLQVPPPVATRTHDLAVANANDCADQAIANAIPRGAAIYLDFEAGGNLAPLPWGPVAVEYCTDFFHRLAERGYRPALYSGGATSVRLRAETPGILGWNVRYPPVPPNAWRVRRGQEVLDTAQVVNNNDIDAVMRQWAQENPPANPLPPLLDETGAVVAEVGGIRPDLNVCLLQDPAYPERRSQPRRLRGGRVAAVAGAASECVIYTVRRGRPARASGPLGAMVRDPNADLVPDDVRLLWNPFASVTALRLAAGALHADESDVMIASGFAEREGDEVWRLQMLRRRVTVAPAPTAPWLLETIPDSGFALDPLPGIAAVSRGDHALDVFAVVNPTLTLADDGQLAVARRDPTSYAWSALTAIGGETARRTNRLAAVSRDAGIANVFWVDALGGVATSESVAATPTVWGAAQRLTDPAIVEVHPFSNIAVVARDANRIDVLFLGRAVGGAAAWRIYNVTRSAAGWGAVARVADDGTVLLEPLAAIAACNRDRGTHLDVFAVGLTTGGLYVTTLTYATDIWVGPRLVGAAPAALDRIASVDSACAHDTAAIDVQVVASSRDGNVWATEFNALTGNYQALVSLAATFPL